MKFFNGSRDPKFWLTIFAISFRAALAEADGVDLQKYRDLVMTVRSSGDFSIPMPDGTQVKFSYQLDKASPVLASPVFSQLSLTPGSDQLYTSFWDKIWLKDGSVLISGDDKIPLTCIYVAGQDNRGISPRSPLFPDFILRVYLVANDFTCTGPVNPGWPSNGGRRTTWDTYLYYEVKDPTIMLPTDTKLMFRRNEFEAVLVR